MRTLVWKHREITSKGSVRWGSQCTTEAAGLSQRPKELAFHIVIIINVIVIIFYQKYKHHEEKWLETHSNVAGCSCGAVVQGFVCAPGTGCGGLGPNRKVKLEVQDKIFSCSPLKKQTNKNQTKTKKNYSPKLFGFERPAKCYSWQLYWSFFLMNIKNRNWKNKQAKKKKKKENRIKSLVSYGLLSYNKMLTSKFFS